MARGAVLCDRMLKTASVRLLMSQALPPGKLLVAVYGDVADVDAAVSAALDGAGEELVDALFIPRVHPDVAHALFEPVRLEDVEALGIVETKTVSAAIRAADASLKAASVELLSLRMGVGIGGRAIYYVSGSVADAQAAVEAGREAIRVEELFLRSEVIAQPHPDFARYLTGDAGRVARLAGVDPPAED